METIDAVRSCPPGLRIVFRLMVTVGVLAAPGCARDAASRPALRDVAGVHGSLQFAVFSSGVTNETPHLWTTRFVNDVRYSGMEDNDIRGFLDGAFKWGWNQPEQIHVRVGRRSGSPRYGEEELFRALLRWAELGLPPASEVVEARLRLTVESGPASPLRMLLYEVKKDWNPGRGGTLRNNVSPPRTGEVWWNDLAYGREAWALPAAGFASRDHRQADTDVMPLAMAYWQPGDTTVDFASEELAAYASRRLAQGKPLLFLLKLSDYLEDQPGGLISIYSGNYGDTGNPARRPTLSLTWRSTCEARYAARDVRLEYGRTQRLEGLQHHGASWAAINFAPESGSSCPAVAFVAEGQTGPPRWIPEGSVVHWLERPAWDYVMIGAFCRPVGLGDPFHAALRDTWILTAPPEDQHVPWVFVAPSGATHRQPAHYQGNWRWETTFVPDELGRWSYTWQTDFAEHVVHSPTGHFDVVAGSLDRVFDGLDALQADIRKHGSRKAPPSERRRWMLRLARLERAGMQWVTPQEFRDESGRQLRARLNRVRGLLGRKVPALIPLRPDRGPPWSPARTAKATTNAYQYAR